MQNEAENAIGRQGFASSSGVQTNLVDKQFEILEEADKNSETVVDNAMAAQDEVIESLNIQKNNLISSYATATGESFGGSNSLNELQAYIDSYGDV